MPRIGGRPRFFLLALVLAAGPAACSTGQVAVLPKVSAVDVVQSAKLQLAVGTATIAQPDATTPFTGLNVVTTFRAADGNNATQLNTPILSAPPGTAFPFFGSSLAGIAPAAFIALANKPGFDPSASVSQGGLIADQSDSAAPHPAFAFGPIVGVYGYGLGAYNQYPSRFEAPSAANANGAPAVGVESAVQGCIDINHPAGAGVSATGPSSSAPRALQNGFALGYGQTDRTGANLSSPLFSGGSDGLACQLDYSSSAAFADTANHRYPIYYFGGPPAWPSPQGYGNPNTFYAYPLGFTDFAVAPAPGTYTLDVAFPASNDFLTSGHIRAQAQLISTIALPVFRQPVLQVNQTDGSATVEFDMPAGATEAVVDITSTDCDFRESGSARGSDFSNHYSILARQSGHVYAFLSGNLGPPDASGMPTHTFCTSADLNGATQTSAPVNFIVAGVAFDYPAYEASYPFNMSAAPAIVGSGGQADITTSYPAVGSYTVTRT